MKAKKQILSFLLAIFMIAPSILSIVHAESIEPNTNTAEDSYVSDPTNENTELLQKSDEESVSSPGIIGEDVTKRDAFSKHYLRTDGTYIAITGAEAIHYQTDSGSWEEIDNSLVLDSSSGYYENANSESGFDIAFSNDASKEEAVMIKDGENSISWYIEALSPNGSKNNASKSTKVKVKNNNANANARINGKGGKENSSISYDDIFGAGTGTTLRYSVSENRIEEDIIFERVPEISAYTMNIKAPGMEATLNADGRVEIIAKNGKAAYTVKAPIMYDSDGVYSADIEVSVERHGNIIKITYAPDMDWLRDESRAYPVTLDPIVETSQYTSNIVDVSVSEFSTATFPGHIYLNVGYGMNGDSVTYIKFNNIPQFGYYLNINSAELILYTTDDSGDISDLELNYVTEAWSPNSIKYDNLPDEYFVCDDMYIYCTQAENDVYLEEEGEYLNTLKYSFDIMDDIDSVTMGGSIDYYWDGYEGFSIRCSDNNYNFISSEHESFDHRPALVFSYSLSTPDFISNGAVYNIYNKMSGTYLSADNTSANVLEETTTELSANEYFKIIESVTSNGTFNGYKLGVMGQSSYALYGISSQGVFGETAIAISSRYISSSIANNQDWLITHVDGNYYKISLRAWPELVLSAYDDGGVYYLNIETFDASDGQLWEIRSNGQTLNENLVNIKRLHSNYSICELVESETLQLFSPQPYIDSTVEWTVNDTDIISFNANTEILSANHAGITSISASIYDSMGDECDVYDATFRVILPNGVYSIFGNSEDVLTVDSAEATSGTDIILEEYVADWNQKWRIKYLGDGYYSIRPLHALNMALDVTGDIVDIWNIGIGDNLSSVPEYALWEIGYCDYGYIFKEYYDSLILTASETGTTAEYEDSYIGVQIFDLLQLSDSYGIMLKNLPETMEIGKNHTIEAYKYSPNHLTNAIAWTSSNSNVAIMSSNGIITTRSAGYVTFTASNGDGSSTSFVVEVAEYTVVIPCAFGTAGSYPDQIKNFPVKINPYLTEYSDVLTDVTWYAYENDAIVFDSELMTVSGIDENIAYIEAHNDYGLVLVCYVVVENILKSFSTQIQDYLILDGSYLGTVSCSSYVNNNGNLDPLVLRTEWFLYGVKLLDQGKTDEEIKTAMHEKFGIYPVDENTWMRFLGEIEYGYAGGYARENLRLSFDGLQFLLNFYWYQYAAYSLATLDTVNVYTPATSQNIFEQQEYAYRSTKEKIDEKIIANAQADQRKGGYNKDDFSTIRLKKGTKLYRVCYGDGSTGSWLTNEEIIAKGNGEYDKTLRYLQIDSNKNTKYFIGEFKVTKDVYVAYGTISANDKFGEGGCIQYFIPEHSTVLKKIGELIELKGHP